MDPYIIGDLLSLLTTPLSTVNRNAGHTCFRSLYILLGICLSLLSPLAAQFKQTLSKAIDTQFWIEFHADTTYSTPLGLSFLWSSFRGSFPVLAITAMYVWIQSSSMTVYITNVCYSGISFSGFSCIPSDLTQSSICRDGLRVVCRFRWYPELRLLTLAILLFQFFS